MGFALTKTLYICGMSSESELSLKVAEFLLKIKAVQLSPKKPFTWSSGWQSPIYCDNRKTLSYPNIRTFIRQEYVRMINDNYSKPDVIAGVATGGIAMGALVAQDLGLPFVYVRSSAKEHGLGNQVEGHIEEGQSVIVIEDLISTGKSSLKAIEALREAKCDVKGLIAIFTYGFKEAEENFAAANCSFHTLSNYRILVEQALRMGFITEAEIESLQAWRLDPANWNK